MANYEATDSSVPSFMTGKLFKGGSFKDFQVAARTRGLRRRLQNAGYEISVYTPDRSRFWMYSRADHIHTSQEIANSSGFPRLAQVSLVRVAPNCLRRETLSATDDLMARLMTASPVSARGRRRRFTYASYKQLSVPLIERFLEDESQRTAHGNYVYAHVILPHPPFVWDASCEPTKDSGFAAQTVCATRLIGEVTAELKRLGRYDDSLIIIQSDHGYHESGDEAAAFADFPVAVKEKLAATARYFDPDGVFRRLHALLLIKPPRAKAEPLRVSPAPAQLVDIPATVYDLVDLPAPGFDGRSIYSLTSSDAREIHVFIGIYDVRAGRTLVLGHNIDRKDLAHISYEAGTGWRVHPDVTATHAGW